MRLFILILTTFFLVYNNIHDNFKTEAMFKDDTSSGSNNEEENSDNSE